MKLPTILAWTKAACVKPKPEGESFAAARNNSIL
jgi:hypothetical protein